MASTKSEAVQKAYSNVAQDGVDKEYADKVAKSFGYSPEQLKDAPANSHMGLSCGNPIDAANLQKDQVVLDLGSGGGFDLILACQKVGENGKVVGIDGSQEMVDLARKNLKSKHLEPPRACVLKAELGKELPIESNSVDCVISNCVVNLLPFEEKKLLWSEVHRVLKPDGRISIDDIVARKPIPKEIADDLIGHIACISGAIEQSEYQQMLQDAGFTSILFRDNGSDLNIYFYDDKNKDEQKSSCCGGKGIGNTGDKPSVIVRENMDVNKLAGAYTVFAVKDTDPTQEVNKSVLKNWWDAFPVAQSSPPKVSVDDVSKVLQDKDYSIIDVRGPDEFNESHVPNAFNHRAQEFYPKLDDFVDQFKNVPNVVFYCGRSQGRGPRAAAWYQDALNSKGITSSQAKVLEGGNKAWQEFASSK